MDVFDEFDSAGRNGTATGTSTADGIAAGSPAPDGTPGGGDGTGERRHSRRRSLLLALAAAVVAVLALVGGAVASAKILFGGQAQACTKQDLAVQKSLTTFLQETVDVVSAEPGTREVLRLGCVTAGDAVGAHTGLIDDPEVEQIRNLLAQSDCTLTDGVPATCSTTVDGATVLVKIVAQPGNDAGDYDLSVIRQTPGA